jgi:hypothetical protein
MAMLLRAIMVLSVLTVVPLVFIVESFDSPDVLLPLMGVVAGMFTIVLLIAWVNRANWGTSVLLNGQTLTLRDYTGRQSSCAIREVRFDDTAIATRDAVVILGRPQAQIYKRADVQERLIPRLRDAQRVGAIGMLKILIQLRHPQGLVTVFAVIGILVFAVFKLAM